MKYFSFSVATLALIFALPLTTFCSFPWKVFYDGVEVTALASPKARQDKVLLDITSLGPTMGIVITMNKEGVKIIDSQGEMCQANWGDFALEGKTKIPLSFPLKIEKGDLFLEAQVLAKLAHKFLEIEEKEKILKFTQASSEEEKTEVFVEEGLATFTVRKIPQELKETKKRLGEFISEEKIELEKKIAHRFVEHDKIRLDTGVSFYGNKKKIMENRYNWQWKNLWGKCWSGYLLSSR